MKYFLEIVMECNVFLNQWWPKCNMNLFFYIFIVFRILHVINLIKKKKQEIKDVTFLRLWQRSDLHFSRPNQGHWRRSDL